MAIYTKEEQLRLIKESPLNLKLIDNQYKEICLTAIKQDGWALQYIKNQTPDLCLYSVSNSGLSLQFVENQTPEICLAAVKNHGFSLQFVKNQTSEICLAAINSIGYSIKFVKKQTPELCLAAVRNNGQSIEYIKNKTPEIYSIALKSYPDAINYIDNPTEEHYIESIKQLPYKLSHFKTKTPTMCFYAFLGAHDLLGNSGVQENISTFIKKGTKFENKIFCIRYPDSYDILKYRDIKNNEVLRLDLKSLYYLEEFLLDNNANNYFLLPNDIDIDYKILSKLVLSNNTLIIIKENKNDSLNKLYTKFANEVISLDDLYCFNF